MVQKAHARICRRESCAASCKIICILNQPKCKPLTIFIRDSPPALCVACTRIPTNNTPRLEARGYMPYNHAKKSISAMQNLHGVLLLAASCSRACIRNSGVWCGSGMISCTKQQRGVMEITASSLPWLSHAEIGKEQVWAASDSCDFFLQGRPEDPAHRRGKLLLHNCTDWAAQRPRKRHRCDSFGWYVRRQCSTCSHSWCIPSETECKEEAVCLLIMAACMHACARVNTHTHTHTHTQTYVHPHARTHTHTSSIQVLAYFIASFWFRSRNNGEQVQRRRSECGLGH
jgi:hypothetical protein